MTLHIESYGEGFPLVFFHGWGFDHKIGLPFAARLEKTNRVYLVDLPGFGLSSLASWEDFKQALLERLPPEFALAGWSLGGLFATRLAIENPERVTYLINIASTPCFIKKQSWSGINQVVFEQFFKSLTTDPQQTLSQFIELQVNGQVASAYYPSTPHCLGLEAGLQVLVEWDLRESLQHFEKPACFMFGKLDAIVPRATMRFMQKKYPQFNYILFDKAAHMPFISEQEEFINTLQRLLQ